MRAMVVINPGNPTGQCLSIDNMREVPPGASEHEAREGPLELRGRARYRARAGQRKGGKERAGG